jgi:hypothetical protein
MTFAPSCLICNVHTVQRVTEGDAAFRNQELCNGRLHQQGAETMPVAVRVKMWVCSRLNYGTECSNSVVGMDVCLNVVCCQVEVFASG